MCFPLPSHRNHRGGSTPPSPTTLAKLAPMIASLKANLHEPQAELKCAPPFALGVAHDFLLWLGYAQMCQTVATDLATTTAQDTSSADGEKASQVTVFFFENAHIHEHGNNKAIPLLLCHRVAIAPWLPRCCVCFIACDIQKQYQCTITVQLRLVVICLL